MGERSGLEGADARAPRWVRLVTGVLLAPPIGAAVLLAAAAQVRLERPADLVVSALALVPVLAALVVRGRLLWLAGALPALRAELRRVADEDRSGPGGTRSPEGEQVAAAADDLEVRLRDRVTVRRLWRLVRWLRSPTSQAGELAERNLGPRASATVATTTGAADRAVGLVALVAVAAYGTVAALLGAVVLGLTAALG